MMLANENSSDLLGADIVELSTKIDFLKNKKRSHDENWLEESKAKLLKLIDDEKRANLIMSRMQKRMKKH